MSLSEELAWRGLIKDKTFEDIKWLAESKTFYLGVDVGFADSLTIGNLAILLLARRLLESGWKTILLVGGATSLIGDPGGKDQERPLVSREEVEHNKSAIAGQVQNLFAGKEFTLVDNYDWFKDVLYLEFLRGVGKHYSLTELIQRDFIAERIGPDGSGISYAEFSYSLIQGYDFWQLYKEYGAVMQIGGSDQWGNMLSGVSLIRKKEAAEAHALSMPLIINKATGAKFGKSEQGGIWLDPAKTTPTQFYQFWINVGDADVVEYLKIFTFLPRKEIEKLAAELKKEPAKRLAQQTLAEKVTELVHGKEETHTAGVITDVLTGKTLVGEVSKGIIYQLRREIPSAKIKKTSNLVDALTASGLASSKTEALRLIGEGGIYVNGRKAEVDDMGFEKGPNILRRGKAYKDSALVELS